MVITGTDAFTAICLSLTALSTGGLAPETGPLAGYVGRVSALILGIFCVIGAMNISVIWDLLRLRRLRNVMSMFKNVEHRGLIVMAALLSLFGLFYVGFNHAFTLVVESLYFVSTAGFDYNVIGIEMLPPVISHSRQSLPINLDVFLWLYPVFWCQYFSHWRNGPKL